MRSMNQQGMKAENKKKVFVSISQTPGISRASIAKQCHFSKTTVSMLVDELIQEGYVRNGGLVADCGTLQGRKPNSLYLDRQRRCLVVVNWCKRHIQFARVNLNCETGSIETWKPEAGERMQEAIPRRVRQFIAKECQGSEILAVCFILPAMIDAESGQVISAVLLKEQTMDFIPSVRKALGEYQLVFFNDTACLAYAEKNYGSGEALDNFVYVNLNDGIGAAFVLDGNILGGVGGIATQFGHFSIDRMGSACVCGGHGCLENEIGEQALSRRITECGARESFADRGQVLFKDVGALAAQGNEDALRVIDALAKDLGYALGNLVTLVNVKLILLGGYGRNLGEYFLRQVRSAMDGVGFQLFVQRTQIEYAALDEAALLRGAARYYMDFCFELGEGLAGD